MNVAPDARDAAAENGADLPKKRKLSVEAIAIIGCVVASFSLIITIVALLPSFKGEQLARKELQLAQWTASKEYLQRCEELAVCCRDIHSHYVTG